MALVGVDVGTGSARAGVFADDGRLLASAKRPVTIWREPGEVVKQSGDQIFSAVCESVREALAAAALSPEDVAGIGFDATCSLVLVDAEGRPVTVSPSGDPERNVIVRMDHRATLEAKEINEGGIPSLTTWAVVFRPKWRRPSSFGSSTTSQEASPGRRTSSTSPTF